MKRTIAIAAAVLTVAACSSGPAAADDIAEEDAPMTMEQAGHVYVRFACPAIAAMHRYERAVEASHHAIGDRSSAKVRLAAKRASWRYIAMAMELGDGTSSWGDWPAEVADDLTIMADAATEDSDWALDDISERGYVWTGDEELMFPDTMEEAAAVEGVLGVHC